MITFDLSPTTELQVERERLEAVVQELISAKVQDAGTLNPLLRSALKGTADLLLSYIGVKPPKGVDKLEYLAAYVLHMGLDAIDGKTLKVEGTLVGKVSDHDANTD